MTLRLVILLSYLLCVNILTAQNKGLNRLFNKIKQIDYQMNPNLSLDNSIHPDRIYFIEENEYPEILEKYKDALNQLKSIGDLELDEQEKISKSIMEIKLNEQISFIEYKMYLIPFNAEGGFYNSPAYYLPKLPFYTIEDYEAYLDWLPSFSDYLKNNIDKMHKGMRLGVLPPKIVCIKNMELMKQWLVSTAEDSPFYHPFSQNKNDLDSAKIDSLANIAEAIIASKILPIYQVLYDFTSDEYMDACYEDVGVFAMPSGSEYYSNRVKHYTTLSLTPDSIFNLGLQEVKRIRAKMESVIENSGFDGDWNSFLKFLRTDEQFYASNGQELLNYASFLSKKAEGMLPQYFSHLYSLPFTVEPVPDEIAPAYTSGRYVHGDASNDVPGTYWVNTYNLKSRTLYTLPALTLHEAVPGHHLQTTLAAEIPNLPEFRNLYYISAFGEGWALYCEYLGEEMGMYATDYELFGRYTYEMWRACRLVVDVGIHDKGWSRKEAFDFMRKNTALSLHEIETEVDRYIGWPGQALSYKIGEIVVKRCREKAEYKLGKRFDLKEFHYHVLKNGSVPLPVLEKEIDNYINHKLSNVHESKESP